MSLPLGTAQPGTCRHTQPCQMGTVSQFHFLCNHSVMSATCAPGPACTCLARPSAPSCLSPE